MTKAKNYWGQRKMLIEQNRTEKKIMSKRKKSIYRSLVTRICDVPGFYTKQKLFCLYLSLKETNFFFFSKIFVVYLFITLISYRKKNLKTVESACKLRNFPWFSSSLSSKSLLLIHVRAL